jgi:hypothetical protein
MPVQTAARKVLARAAAHLGGVRPLSSRLRISELLLQRFITGERPVPDELFLRAVDVVLEHLPEETAHKS